MTSTQKLEFRNPKSETNPKSKIRMFQTAPIGDDPPAWDGTAPHGVLNFGFRALNSFRISCFGFRASDFVIHSSFVIRHFTQR